nr:hypothetical protein [Cronobacter sakazakii]
MTEKPQVDFEEVVKASGMPVTKEALRERFNGIVQDPAAVCRTQRGHHAGR